VSPLTHVGLFGAGVASFLAPCVLPLVPAYVAMIAGQAATSPAAIGRGALAFVGGFASVFVALGGFAGWLGSRLDLFEVWVQRVGGALVVVFGLLLLASWRGWFAPEAHLLSGLPAADTVIRPLVMGVAFGAAWTPCVGPVLGTALVLAAQSSTPWRGATLLGAYALGIGVPFVVAALALSSWPAALRRLQHASRRLEPVAGAALVTLGVLLAFGLYDRFLDPLAPLVPGSA
jgi:cytochrome c-type biogenesis protein